MRQDRKDIIEEFLKTFKFDRNFETDKFIYWIKESYSYDGQSMNRDEFQCVKDYAIKYGTLPFLTLKEKEEENSTESDEHISYNRMNRNTRTNTHSRQQILRYSKSYGNVEFYSFDQEVRATTRNDSGRILVMSKKRKLFSINDKNYVLINGNRWLSLKNVSGFINRNVEIRGRFGLMLLNMMLGGDKNWILNLEDKADKSGMEQSYNISNKSSRVSGSLDEAVAFECGTVPPKIIMKYFNDNVNEVINLYNLIEHNKVHYLTNFIKKNIEILKKLSKSGTGYSKSTNLLFYYFASRDNRCDISTFADYIRMLQQEGGKINLNISSYVTIKSKHDEISRVILEKNRDKRKLRVSNVYPKIESIPGIEVELIKSADRLNFESEMLHHCVHGYKQSINNGSCAIYSLVHDGERYTLEVRAKKLETPEQSEDEKSEDKYELKINQLRGKYNCNPPTSMKEHLERMCENNELILSDRSVTFVDRVKEKERREREEPKVEVQQIGEKILEHFLKNSVRAFENTPF